MDHKDAKNYDAEITLISFITFAIVLYFLLAGCPVVAMASHWSMLYLFTTMVLYGLLRIANASKGRGRGCCRTEAHEHQP